MRPGPRSARSRPPAGPNFSKPLQGKSKLFQGNSNLFQAFSKDFQIFSLAVSNEINALAATPAILPFLRPARPNSPRSQSAPGERRAIVRRSRRGSPRRPSLVGYHEFCFSGRKMSRALGPQRMHRACARRPLWRGHAAIVKCARAVTGNRVTGKYAV